MKNKTRLNIGKILVTWFIIFLITISTGLALNIELPLIEFGISIIITYILYRYIINNNIPIKKCYALLSITLAISFIFCIVSPWYTPKNKNEENSTIIVETDVSENNKSNGKSSIVLSQSENKESATNEYNDTSSDEGKDTNSEQISNKENNSSVSDSYISDYAFERFTQLNIEACSLSGTRQPNAVVDIGFGDREYWAFTNEYGQLVKVMAKEIIIQDDSTELVNSKGRYCADEAKVSGTERSDLDEGHIIADSLGGVSNAYNITPQNSDLNRYGEQADMEQSIRNAGGVQKFYSYHYLSRYHNTNT